jgi:uncharacterized protein (TIGR00288 family)
MRQRQSRRAPTAKSSHAALVHRGPGAHASVASHGTPPIHSAPNAALLIDFDNVTMGIRSDLGKELRNLLSSEIIKGKVAVQRAYADWRRYPQYIVPLSEASIDLIFAPAYGSSKKNATDIRLAIDALELVFTRSEIGTFILLSGDSDFSSLVIKLKEYGKYVIGVGIRESSSDLLVQNCDEYYSYNALAGLVKSSDDEPRKKHDPWELVTEAINQMKRNHDVMRSDRLKQVMQEIDPSFDESNVNIAKFSRFCQEAAAKGLLSVRRLENGQLEVNIPGEFASDTPISTPAVAEPAREGGGGRRRRGGRGRGRGGRGRSDHTGEHPVPAAAASAAPAEEIGLGGELLTRDEAFDLVRRATSRLVDGDATVPAAEVRVAARKVLGRDSGSLSDRYFSRILKDAHENGIIVLRLDGDNMEVGRVAVTGDEAEAPAVPSAPALAPMGLRGRSAGGRGRAIPPELLALGVVESPTVVSEDGDGEAPRRGRKKAKAADGAAPKRPRKPRAKKAAKAEKSEE